MTFDYFKNSQLIEMQQTIHLLQRSIDLIVDDRKHKLGLLSETSLEEHKTTEKYFPEDYYNFQFFDVEIKIGRLSGSDFKYSVFCHNYKPSNLPIWSQYSLKQYDNHFGCFTSLDEAKSYFKTMVVNCLEQHFGFQYELVKEFV